MGLAEYISSVIYLVKSNRAKSVLKRTKPVEIFKDIFWTGFQYSHLHQYLLMITFTNHALQRMGERGISKKEVKEAINNADYFKHEADKIIAHKRLNKKTIEVVFTKRNSKIIIITSYQL